MQEPEVPFYIAATAPATRPRRTLKYGDCFGIFDSHGDIGATAGAADGLYYKDTRYLSHFELLLNGMQLLLLGSYGCSRMQGFLFGKPAPPELFERWLANPPFRWIQGERENASGADA